MIIMGLSRILGVAGDALAALLRPETTDTREVVGYYLPLADRAILSVTALNMVACNQHGLVDDLDIRGVADLLSRDKAESDALVQFLHHTAIEGD